MHLESALAGQHPMTDDTLVRIHQFILDIIHQLLEL